MKAVWFDDKLHRKLKVAAFNLDIPMNKLAEIAINEYIDKNKKAVTLDEHNGGDL